MSDQQQQRQRPKIKASSVYLNQSAGGTWSEFFGDIYSGIAVGMTHSKWFIGHLLGQDNVKDTTSLTGESSSSPEASDMSSNNSSIDDKNTKPQQGLKVVGVGYGRTGTYSLALALDELGFPTLHTQHHHENPKIFAHFVDNIFYKSVQQDEVITPDMFTPDFDLLPQGGFTATMDLPFALYYKQIHEMYPDCKFILTVRENAEVWFRSWDVLTRSITKPAQVARMVTHVRRLNYYMRLVVVSRVCTFVSIQSIWELFSHYVVRVILLPHRWLFSVVNSDKIYLNAPFPLPPQNKAKSIASYEAHNENVRNSLPSSHLLEYNVRQGWEPLCSFLEIPEADCPSTLGIPFPKSNSARAVTWQAYSSFLGPVVIGSFIFFSVFSVVFRKITGMSVISWTVLMKARFMHWTNESLKEMKRNNSKKKKKRVSVKRD